MSDRKLRPVALADRIRATDGPRFLGSGKPQRYGASKTEYEPLLVRSGDKTLSLQLLTVAGEIASDVALLLDVVLAQGRLLAEQSAEFARLRQEVDALRSERLATDVTKQVNDALLQAGKDGVGIEGFVFEVAISNSERSQQSAAVERKKADESDGLHNWSTTAGIGAIMQTLADANMSAEHSKQTVERVHQLLMSQTNVLRASRKEVSGTLRVERIIGAK